MNKKLTTVVFDVGMVLLEWDPRNLYRKIFADPAEMEWFLANVCTDAWNIAQDKGRPWPEAEAEAIAQHPTYAPQIRAFRARWHEMVPGPIQGTVTILEQLSRAGVPLYAITNFAADTFAESRARFAFFKLFRSIVVSGEIGVLKPDPAIYHRLAADHDVELSGSVFIDDSEKNVQGANAVGMTGHHFTSPRDLGTYLTVQGFVFA